MAIAYHWKRLLSELYGTVETRIEDPTFLGDSLLKAHIFCLYNPYIREG